MIQAEKTYRGTLGVGRGLSITRQEGHGEGREGREDEIRTESSCLYVYRDGGGLGRRVLSLLTAPDTAPTDPRQRVFLLLGAWSPQGPSLGLTLKNLPFIAQDLCGGGRGGLGTVPGLVRMLQGWVGSHRLFCAALVIRLHLLASPVSPPPSMVPVLYLTGRLGRSGRSWSLQPAFHCLMPSLPSTPSSALCVRQAQTKGQLCDPHLCDHSSVL